jgi:flavin reductase (DIM6/NTAB) family NADH-FMN oxidoreductase RutF
VPRSVDEFTLAELTPVASRLVKPPRVKESPVHLECTHLKTVELPSNDPQRPTLVVVGRVVGIHIDDSIIADGMIDMDAFKPIARLGYMDYTLVDNVLTMARP